MALECWRDGLPCMHSTLVCLLKSMTGRGLIADAMNLLEELCVVVVCLYFCLSFVFSAAIIGG
jgi:hypothetical protein